MGDIDPVPTSLLIVEENERVAGHYVSWMSCVEDAVVAYTGSKTIKAATSSCTAAAQEAIPDHYQSFYEQAMMVGIPRGTPLQVHYTLEKAKAAIEKTDKVLTVKEEQRLRREKKDLERARVRAEKEQKKAESPSQPATQSKSGEKAKKKVPAVKPKPKPKPSVDPRTQEEIRADRVRAGLPAGKSLKATELAQIIAEESSDEDSHHSTVPSSVSSSDDEDIPLQPPPAFDRKGRPIPQPKPKSGKRTATEAHLHGHPLEAEQAVHAEPTATQPSAEPSASQSSAAQELLQRVTAPEKKRKSRDPEH